MRPHLEHLEERADLLLLAGDLTRHGDPAEARVVARELRDISIPKVAVLGNHDHHLDRVDDLMAELEAGGIRVLEGAGVVLEVSGHRVGVAGVKGFGGGFAGACATDFGERETKAFIGHTRERACALEQALRALDAPVRIALVHYSPAKGTLLGEKLEIYPFLGSYLLAEAIDSAGADLVLHGHAHGGCEKSITPGGVPVRNVAQPVIKQAYRLYGLDESRGLEPAGRSDEVALPA